MGLIEKCKVAAALEIGITATLQNAHLPRLSDSEHSALITIQTVALLLEMNEVAGRVAQLVASDLEACGSRFCRELREHLSSGGTI